MEAREYRGKLEVEKQSSGFSTSKEYKSIVRGLTLAEVNTSRATHGTKHKITSLTVSSFKGYREVSRW